MADFGTRQDSRSEVDLRLAAAELRVLRSALEVARNEVRNANVSAGRVARLEKVLARERARTAEARRLARQWRQSSKKWRKEYERITSTLVWRIYSPFDRALRRGRSFFHHKKHHLGLKGEVGRSSVDVLGHGSKVETILVEGLGIATLITESEINRTGPNRDEGCSTASSSTYKVPDLGTLGAFTPRGRIAVVLHLHYPELWSEFRNALSTIPEPYDLFVTLTLGYSDEAANWIWEDFPAAQIITLENRGRDILPFIVLVNSGVLFNYEIVCKLHTKRSPHFAGGENWRRSLIAGLFSDTENVAAILRAFDSDPDLGIVTADGFLRDDSKSWSKHLARVSELSRRIGIPAVIAESGWPKFAAGSIFWMRASLLRPIAALKLTPSEFEPEPIPPNACMSHVIERLFGHLCREAGMRIVESSDLAMTRKGIASAKAAPAPQEVKPVDS